MSGATAGPASQKKAVTNMAPERKAPQPISQTTPPVNSIWQVLSFGAQAKLSVSAPDDPSEREADRVADAVMDSAPVVPVSEQPVASVSLKCAHCDEREEESEQGVRIARKPSGSPPSLANPSASRLDRASSGAPLPIPAQQFFQDRLGADFSSVRIHDSADAHAAASRIGARAFTVGDDIAFAAGEYDPMSHAGRHLLAHELAHTLQQRKEGRPILRPALDPANRAAWDWFAREYRRRDEPEIFAETLAAASGASLEMTESMTAASIPTEESALAEWRERFAGQAQTLVRLNALGLMASHKATIEGRRDELLHPPADASGPSADSQIRNAADLLNRLTIAKDYLEWSRVALGGVGSEARTGWCWSMSDCVDDWLQTMHANIQRYQPEAMREYWNERIETLSRGVSSDIMRAFFSFFSDTLVEWRERQIAGANRAMAEVYDQFPLFAALDAEDVMTDPDYATEAALATAAAEAYAELLNDVDEAVVEIGSGDIHPFNLPEAVRLTRDSLPEAMQSELDLVLRDHEVVEFWTTMGLTFAQVFSVFIPVVGPALAFGIGAITTAVDIESLLDRIELSEASTSPDGDMLGAAAPSGFDYLMVSIEAILTAVDLGMMLHELRGARALGEEAGALTSMDGESGAARTEGEARGSSAGDSTPGSETLGSERVGETPTDLRETATGVSEPNSAALDDAVHADAHRTGAEVELSDGTHGVSAAGSGETQGFYFCSDFCALLVDKLDALLQALPPDFPDFDVFREIRGRALYADRALRRGAMTAAEADARAASLAAELERVAGGNPGVHRLLDMAPEEVSAQAGAIRRDIERSMDAARTRLEETEGMSGAFSESSIAPESPEGLGMDVVEGSSTPRGHRIPRGTAEAAPDVGGMWGGERGNSEWFSDITEVNEVTGYEPIEFVNGEPNLRPWARERVILTEMEGVDADFAAADRGLLRQYPDRWPNQTAVERWRSAEGLTWHHEPDLETMTLVPTALHENVPHIGGASRARAGARPERVPVLGTHPLQREVAIPAKEIEELQRKALGSGATSAADDVASGMRHLQGRGMPLSDRARSYFEPRFGADLSAVRIHNDGHANDMAQSINAKAFTLGRDIVFGAGHYSPESSDGKRLMAHELTHTLQQGAVKTVAPSVGHLVRAQTAGSVVQRVPTYDEKHFLIQKALINGDHFEILLKHFPVDGRFSIKITYKGPESFFPGSSFLSVKSADLKDPVDRNEYSVQENIVPPAAVRNHQVLWFPYVDKPTVQVELGDLVELNTKWAPPRRTHRFVPSVSGAFDITRPLVGNVIEIIPNESIPSSIEEPEYKDIEIPNVPELSASQALLAAKISITEILDNKDVYPLQARTVIELLKKDLEDKHTALDPTKDNSESARIGTGVLRTADYYKRKVPSVALFMQPGYFPAPSEDDARALVKDVINAYEMALILSNGGFDKTNDFLKKGDHKLLRLPYQLTNLLLKKRDGGLDALTEQTTSLAVDIQGYRSAAGVGPKFVFLDQEVLGIGGQKVPGMNMTSSTPTAAARIEGGVDALRIMHAEGDLEAFTKVMVVASMARGYKSIFSMLAVYELLRFYRTGYHGGSSWAIDAILPGSGEDTVDGYISSIGKLLQELEDAFKARGGITEEYLADVLKRFTAIAGNEAFEKDLKFIVDRLNTIAKVKAVVKALLVVIAAALGAAIIGPAAGAIAAEAGLGVTGVGLVTFGAEVLSFTVISQLGDELMFGRTDMGFFEALLHNAVTFGILKGVARVHRLAFAKFAEPKFYPKLFTATGAATQFVSLYGLGMVQHALPPSLGGKGRMMTAEEQGWMIVQNIALLGAMALASKITAPIREQLEQKTFDALTENAKKNLAALDANRQALKEEHEALRKLGVAADPVRRQRFVNAIEQQYNSDIAWFKEALKIMQRHPAVLGLNKAAVEKFIGDYRAQIDKLVVSMMENGYDFKPGGSDIVKFVEPGVMSYASDAFKSGDVDPLTGEKREVVDLGNGNFEVKVGGRRMLYVPQGDLPVNVADPKGIRALVEYYKFDWESTKRAFGSDGSTEMNSLMAEAWRQGWRPGQPVPPETKAKIFEHFQNEFDKELDVYKQQVRNLPEKPPTKEEGGEIIIFLGEDSPFRVPGPITRGELLTDSGIAAEIKRFQKQLESLLNKLNPDMRRGLTSLYTSKALSFLMAEKGGTADTSKYPTPEEILEAAPLFDLGGFSKYPELIQLLLADRAMLWLLFEFRDNPKRLVELYEAWKKKGATQSFREYGRRYLFKDEFDRAEKKLKEHIEAEKAAKKALKDAASPDEKRSLQDRFGADWKSGTDEADRVHNNSLVYKDSEPSILQAHQDGKLPTHLSAAMDTALKGDHLSGIDPTQPGSYDDARKKIVGIVNLGLKDSMKSYADYLALVDLATQRAAIGRIGEGFTKAMEVEVGLPGGGKKVTIHLDAKAKAAIDAARVADGKDKIFKDSDKWVTIDLFYDSGHLIGEVKVGTSYELEQLQRYASVVLYKDYIKQPLKDAGITSVDGIFYVILPGRAGGDAAAPAVQERQAAKVRKDAEAEGVGAVTKVRFVTRDGSLFEQTDSKTKVLVKTIK